MLQKHFVILSSSTKGQKLNTNVGLHHLIVSKHDACETLELSGKWPRTFICEEDMCPKCGLKLLSLVKRQQNNNSDKKLLISKLHVLEIELYSKKCKHCFIMLSPDTLQYGLLNIGDTSLISLDVFFTLRNTIR